MSVRNKPRRGHVIAGQSDVPLSTRASEATLGAVEADLDRAAHQGAPLPIGAATEAAQDLGNLLLEDIDRAIKLMKLVTDRFGFTDAGALTVSGGSALTDLQLRATAVPIAIVDADVAAFHAAVTRFGALLVDYDPDHNLRRMLEMQTVNGTDATDAQFRKHSSERDNFTDRRGCVGRGSTR